MIRKLSTFKVVCDAPVHTLIPIYPRSEFIAKVPFKSAEHFYESLPPVPTYADASKLPVVPTDIKGIDTALHLALNQIKVKKPIPRLCSNQYFNLRFYPSDHHICRFRKSTVAYAFTNKSGYQLNSPKLEEALGAYKGSYKGAAFFKTNLRPLTMACGRSRYRKLVKRTLFKVISDYAPDVQHVSGLFKFSFKEVPRSLHEREIVHKELIKAITTLTSKSFRKKLQIGTIASNKHVDVSRMSKHVSHENTLNASSIRGVYKKLPFL